MRAKHAIHDRVRINSNAPRWIRELAKYQRTRAVLGHVYIKSQQRLLYQLGGDIPYSFRANMLTPVTVEQSQTRGRPKTKRRYIRHDNTTTTLSAA